MLLCSLVSHAELQLKAMQQQVLALQDELTAGHKSLAAAQKVPTAFNLNDYTSMDQTVSSVQGMCQHLIR
jgi:hypothetical protein